MVCDVGTYFISVIDFLYILAYMDIRHHRCLAVPGDYRNHKLHSLQDPNYYVPYYLLRMRGCSATEIGRAVVVGYIKVINYIQIKKI